MTIFAIKPHLRFGVVLAGILLCGGAKAATCESLASLSVSGTTIAAAAAMPAAGNLPAYCRVAGTAKPSGDSEINFEVWMPASGWNGKFNGTGNGGYGGSLALPLREMAVGIARGYAAAGTDMGHVGKTPGVSDARWALNHPEKIADWGHRANHVVTVAAKAIVTAFYGSAPKLSYWTGCSDGGHEALMEAQRYPEDYNGIIAGAAANDWTGQSVAWIWEGQAALMDLGAKMSPAKLTMVTHAAVEACDALDGIKDGIIADPRKCRFDPAVLQCKAADAPDCLSAAQVAAVKKIYAGPHSARTGKPIYPGLEPGSESGWAQLIAGPESFQGGDYFKYFVFNKADWDFRTLDYDKDVATALGSAGTVVDSTNPDLHAFKAHGGKMILYHGWADPLVNPRNSIAYYEKAVAQSGKNGNPFLRLFMVPGMGHCIGGVGPNAFGQPLIAFNGGKPDAARDILTALENWVENGAAPDKIVAPKYVGNDPSKAVERTRPLCAYPRVAHWNGSGSSDDAGNFSCVPEKTAAQ